MPPLHNRMPVILSPEEYGAWIDPELTEPEQLLPMLDQYPGDEMAEHSVSTLVGSERLTGTHCAVSVNERLGGEGICDMRFNRLLRVCPNVGTLRCV